MNIDNVVRKITGSAAWNTFTRYVWFMVLCGYFAGIMVIFLGLSAYWNYFEVPEAQPIAFSHAKHVSTVGLPCAYCHVYAEKSRHAVVPPVQTCMSCHENVATEKPGIKKLASAAITFPALPCPFMQIILYFLYTSLHHDIYVFVIASYKTILTYI